MRETQLKKYRILFFGNWGLGKAGLEALHKSNKAEIVHVFTKWRTDAVDPFMNCVYDYANSLQIPVFNTEKSVCDKKHFLENATSQENIDLLISCCYDRIFTPEILRVGKLASINVHPSLLPRQRGIKPLENAIVSGDLRTGVTVHVLTEGLDEGDILLQDGSIEILEGRTFASLFEEQCRAAGKLIAELMQDPEGYLAAAIPQEGQNASLAPRLPIPIEQNDTVEEIRRKFVAQNS